MIIVEDFPDFHTAEGDVDGIKIEATGVYSPEHRGITFSQVQGKCRDSIHDDDIIVLDEKLLDQFIIELQQIQHLYRYGSNLV